MTSTILLVDDEPDLETLVQQKFRRQIRDGQVRFLFARDAPRRSKCWAVAAMSTWW